MKQTKVLLLRLTKSEKERLSERKYIRVDTMPIYALRSRQVYLFYRNYALGRFKVSFSEFDGQYHWEFNNLEMFSDPLHISNFLSVFRGKPLKRLPRRWQQGWATGGNKK